MDNNQPPPRPPKKQHLQSRKLSPSSLERIRQRHEQENQHVKFKPPAPDPDPMPPDFGVTQQWLQQVASNSEYLIEGQRSKVNLDTSDSGCSSLASRSPSSATSPMMHQPKANETTPDLLLWNRDTPADILLIKQKLADLQGQKLDFEEAIRQNDSLGQGIASLVETRATPREVSKFRFHIEDTEKITNLLVSLSGRLARTETSIEYLEESETANCDEKIQLTAKRTKLREQLNEAKQLQENIQKRSMVVCTFLQKYLNPSEFQNFQTFLDKKSKLIMESRELGDRISLCEEQIKSMENNYSTAAVI